MKVVQRGGVSDHYTVSPATSSIQFPMPNTHPYPFFSCILEFIKLLIPILCLSLFPLNQEESGDLTQVIAKTSPPKYTLNIV